MADFRSEIAQIFNKIEHNAEIAEIMTTLEQLRFSETFTVNCQVKLVTELANNQIFHPKNSTDAEQKLNGLLKYLASESYVVCSLACSLMKIYCDNLNKNGQHIATQVMISCKNLLTIITKSGDKNNCGLTICQSIALASMCSIATEWSNKLEQLNQWLPLALLALNTVFGVLLTKTMHIFIQQVAAQGLCRTLNIPQFWSSLTTAEQSNALGHLKQLFEIQLKNPVPFILIKLLETTSSKDVAGSVCGSKYLKFFLQVCVKFLPEKNQCELDKNMPLDVGWMCLKLLWTLLDGMKVRKIVLQDEKWEIYLERLKSLCRICESTFHFMQELKEEIHGHFISKLQR